MSKLKIAMVSSSGGHLVQLSRLYEGMSKYNYILYTTARYEQIPERMRILCCRVFPDANLRTPFKVVWLSFSLLSKLAKDRPDIVISTGAAPGAICIILAKLLFGSRCIWIDSLANAQKMSLSGRIVKRVSDLWLSQWEDVAKVSGAAYMGKVI